MRRVKRVTMNTDRTSFEFEDPGGGGGGGGLEEEEVVAAAAVAENLGPATRVMNAITRTCELGNVRAPKELWLV